MYTLFVARGYPTEKYKTYGIFEFDQAKALAKAGVKVVYAAVDYRSIRRWRQWGIRKIKKDGVDIYSINIPIGNIPKHILRKLSIKGLKRLYKTIEKDQGKPDLIHAHFINEAYSASFLKEDLNIPLVVTEHSSKINTSSIEEKLLHDAKRAYKSADRVIAVSTALVKKIDENFNIKATYIANIVDLDIFKYKEKKQEDGFLFVSTGNLIPLKRMDLLIESFYEAFKDKEDIFLKIFGQGVEKDRLQSLINKYKLEEKVELMGLCSREDIAATLNKADCFALASQSETFGVAYTEALAMGVPVISTRCGGPEGFINQQNGLIIDVDDKAQLIDAMEYMYNNIGQYKREEISQEIKAKFSSQVVAKEIIDIYKSVL